MRAAWENGGEMDPLLKIPEVAELLGVSEPTLRDWCYSGLFPFVRLGGPAKGPIRFSRPMIEQFIEARTIKPGDVPPPPLRVAGGRSGRRPGQRARTETIGKFAKFCMGEDK
jgi:excisionase family DNA binding protein